MTGPPRFAHLSDPHLTTLSDVRWRDLLNKRVLGYLSWRRRRRFEHRADVLAALRHDLDRAPPDHVVVTGDLTQIGLPAEFIEARRWLDALGAPADVTVIPGNHDAYVAVPWSDSYRHWQPYMDSDESWHPGDAGRSHFPSVRVRSPVAFIGLNSALPAPPFMACGTLGAAQLEQLATILDETGRAGLFRVVLIHHPPVPGEEKWRKRLTDAASLCRVIAAHGAELVLHGHRHRAVDSTIPGTAVPVFGVPSASALGRSGHPAQYYRFEVERRGDEWSVQLAAREYRREHGRFDEGRRLALTLAAAPQALSAGR